MRKLLLNDTWYDEVSPRFYYEREFESILKQNLGSMFPDAWVVNFKVSISSEDRTAGADLALIDRRYRKWSVVEVELEHHSLMDHILPQVSTLADGRYGPEIGEYLCRQQTQLCPERIRDMLKGNQPEVIVISNKDNPDWHLPLARLGVRFITFQIFRSEHLEHAFLVDGHAFEEPNLKMLSECYFEGKLNGFMVLRSPAALPHKHSERVVLNFKDGLTEWVRMDVKTRVWLRAVGNNPLDPKGKYGIYQGDHGLYLKELE
jgi:hypothetical protein